MKKNGRLDHHDNVLLQLPRNKSPGKFPYHKKDETKSGSFRGGKAVMKPTVPPEPQMNELKPITVMPAQPSRVPHAVAVIAILAMVYLILTIGSMVPSARAHFLNLLFNPQPSLFLKRE